jgi:hypothetical protein
MIIQYKQTNHKTYCAVCKKNIAKGKIIIKYDEVIDGWNNTRVFYAHIRCLILKLLNIKSKLEKAKKALPKDIWEINRYIKEDKE